MRKCSATPRTRRTIVLFAAVLLNVGVFAGCRGESSDLNGTDASTAPVADSDGGGSVDASLGDAATSEDLAEASLSGDAGPGADARARNAPAPRKDDAEADQPKREVAARTPRQAPKSKSPGSEGSKQLDVPLLADDGVPVEKRLIRVRKKKRRPARSGLEIVSGSETKSADREVARNRGRTSDEAAAEPAPASPNSIEKKAKPMGTLEMFEKLRDPDFRTQMAKKLRTMEKPPPEPQPPPAELDGFENRVVTSEAIVSQPMVETATDPLSTFSVDVDTGAYTLARARLREGYLPKADDVRVEEFLNYFHYDYPQPEDGEFSVALDAAPDPFTAGDDRHLFRIGVQGRDVAEDERPPAHLTFLVDVSGSMFGPDKLGLAREALELVTRNLRADDTVAMVTYARGADVRLWPAGATESDIVLANIAAMEPGGSSSLDEGLQLAYDVASSHFHAGQSRTSC